ncbi:MAG: hypothetical protein EBQ96_01985 [Proteobacteria bacterium]|nr:hypothetical protein [Pseudomonadota bacterium]
MFLSRTIHFLFLLLLAAWVAFPFAGRAEELIPLPELSPEFQLEAYAAGTDTIRKEFEEIPTVGFELSLPKVWVERSALGMSYGELVRYEGPAVGDVRPYFSFKRVPVKRENTARMELIAYLLKQGYVLRAIKEIDDRNVDALYVTVNDSGDSFGVRAQIRINGSDMLMGEYAVPITAWNELRDEQTFALKSFKFLKDVADPIEKRVERTYFKVLRFFYPASWLFLGEQTPAENTVSINFANRSETGVEGGRIKITVASTKPLKDEKSNDVFKVDVPEMLKAARKSYETRNFIIGKTLENRAPVLNIPVSFAALNAYELHTKTTEYEVDNLPLATHELWLAVFRTKAIVPKTYVVELFTPSRTQDIYLWSINTRAFEIILKSIQ